MIDVQDRCSTTGPTRPGTRPTARGSVVEIGNAIGWDNAHDAIYAGALDIAVGPRWHSVYEMACNVVTIFIEGKEVHAVPQGGTTERERALLGQYRIIERSRERGADRRADPSARARLYRKDQRAVAGRQIAAPDHRRDPAGRRASGAGDGRAEQFLDAAAHLRVLQYDRLVLRQFRAPAAAEAALCGGLDGQPGGVEPAQLRLAQIRADQRAERRRPADRQPDHRAPRGGVCGARPARGRRLDQGLSRQRRGPLATRRARSP